MCFARHTERCRKSAHQEATPNSSSLCSVRSSNSGRSPILSDLEFKVVHLGSPEIPQLWQRYIRRNQLDVGFPLFQSVSEMAFVEFHNVNGKVLTCSRGRYVPVQNLSKVISSR